MRSRLYPLAAIFALVGCVEAAAPSGPQAATASAPQARPAQPDQPAAPVRFIEDDIAGAAAKARAEGKALFVDAWAPWCHTCLSMKNFVLSDPALAALADRVVFASIDTDRPEAAAFLAKHTVKAWPTFFVIDPTSDKAVGYWAGSASLGELRALLEEGVSTLRGGALDPAGKAFAAARAAHASGDLATAAKRYQEAIAAAPAGWPNRGAAHVGWIEALAGAKSWAECAALGQARAAEAHGSSAPGDFCAYLLSCAEKLPSGPEQTAARKAAVARLKEITARPPADASVDDRQDAYATLAEGLEALGDATSARAAQEARLALLEQAARAARTPALAQTFDYARAGAYTALGRGEEAVKMLTARERELPDSYEPPARLAGVLYKMGKMDEALAAVDRAVTRAYGPRKLRYLKLRGDILSKKGDMAGALGAVREEVKGWESLAPGQASPEQLAEAKRRLEEAEKKAAR